MGADLNDTDLLVAHLGVQTDWETRVIYTQFSMDSYFSESPIYLFSGRVGFSPYLVEYNGLHTWIIAQLDAKITDNTSDLSVLPVVRFFKNNYLFEFGSNFTNKFLVTLMFHF